MPKFNFEVSKNIRLIFIFVKLGNILIKTCKKYVWLSGLWIVAVSIGLGFDGSKKANTEYF